MALAPGRFFLPHGRIMAFSLSPSPKRGIHGFGLFELILVATTVLIAIGVVCAVFESAKPSAASAAEAGNVTTLVVNLKSAHAAHPQYANATAREVIRTHLAPMGLIDPKNTTGGLRSQWGTVILNPVPGSSPAQFEVLYTNVPAEACPTFIAALNTHLLDTITINGTAVTTPGQPLSPAALTHRCGDNAPTAFVTVAMRAH
jgi:hypothetical protein